MKKITINYFKSNIFYNFEDIIIFLIEPFFSLKFVKLLFLAIITNNSYNFVFIYLFFYNNNLVKYVMINGSKFFNIFFTSIKKFNKTAKQ